MVKIFFGNMYSSMKLRDPDLSKLSDKEFTSVIKVVELVLNIY